MSHEVLTLASFETGTYPSQVISDVHARLCGLAAGKRVLNVGACGFIRDYLPHNPQSWIHHKLGQVTKATGGSLLGIDINAPAIQIALENGYPIANRNCETDDLGGPYDLIILMDVIEHLNAPGLAIPHLMQSLAPGGQMIITTPHAYSFAALVRNLLGRPHPTFDDHIHLYAPEHFIGLARRFGIQITEISFYTLVQNTVRFAPFRRWFYRKLLAIQPKWGADLWVSLKNKSES